MILDVLVILDKKDNTLYMYIVHIDTPYPPFASVMVGWLWWTRFFSTTVHFVEPGCCDVIKHTLTAHDKHTPLIVSQSDDMPTGPDSGFYIALGNGVEPLHCYPELTSHLYYLMLNTPPQQKHTITPPHDCMVWVVTRSSKSWYKTRCDESWLKIRSSWWAYP